VKKGRRKRDLKTEKQKRFEALMTEIDRHTKIDKFLFDADYAASLLQKLFELVKSADNNSR
jgi:hypothetical protein